jgi:hypothetical protein
VSVWPKKGLSGHRGSGIGLGRGENEGKKGKCDLKRRLNECT